MIEKNKIFREVSFRLRLLRFTGHFFTGLLWTFILGCLVIILSKLVSFKAAFSEVFLGAFGAALLYSFIRMLLNRQTPIEAALYIEKELGFQERVSSAIALERKEDPFVRALLNDAKRALGTIDVRKDFPLKLPSIAPYIFIPLVISLAIYSALPRVDLFKYEEKQELKKIEKQRVKEQGEKLEKKIKAEAKKLKKDETAEKQKQKIDYAEKVRKEVEKLAKDLQNKNMVKKDALLKISKVKKELTKQKEKLQIDENLYKRLRQATDIEKLKDLQQALKKGEFKEAAKRLQELMEKIKKGELSQEELDKIAKEMQKLAQMLSSDSKLAEALKKTAMNINDKELMKAMEQLMKASEQAMNMEQMMQQLKQMDAMMAMLKDAQQGIGQGGERADKSKYAKGKGSKDGEGDDSGGGYSNGPDAGIGTTNEFTGNYDIEEGFSSKDRFSDERSDWQEEFIQMYNPERIQGAQTVNEYVKGKLDNKKDMQHIEMPLEPSEVVPQAQIKGIVSDYARSQKERVNREEIPNYYKKSVQNYFDSIQ